jgi:GT2 family glycosyltransferase
MSFPPIGVVIATRDRRERLCATLARVRALPERPAVVVVDDGSRDGTARAVADRFPDVEVVRLEGGHGAAARNAGVERLGTRYAAFLDDDSWWAPGALARAVEVLDAHPRVGLLAARVLVGDDARLDPTCAAMARSPLTGTAGAPGRAVLGFVACGAVVRRDAFLRAGGFDRRYGIGGEEARLAVALAGDGWDLRYVPEVVAHHHPSPSDGRSGRRARTLRNDLWTTWSARPAGAALRATAQLVRGSGWHGHTLAGLLAAARGAPWVLRERRVVPAGVESDLRRLEPRRRRASRSA